MTAEPPADLGKTTLRRMEQYRDRWSSFDAETGLEELSSKPTPEELKQFEIFAGYDDRFLEKISTDVSIATWKPDSVLFEEGSYLDLAFYVAEGEVEVFLEAGSGRGEARPIFDLSRTVLEAPAAGEGGAGETVLMRRASRPTATPSFAGRSCS